jgi:hypothetical protein
MSPAGARIKDCFTPGDGTVTRDSMLTISRVADMGQYRCLFFCQSHGSLFKDNTLKDNLLFELLNK